MPSRRLPQFKNDIGRARELVGLGQSISSLTYGMLDGDDLYRAALVQSVSALDSYVHGVVLDRGVDIIMGHSVPGSSNSRIGMPLHVLSSILKASGAMEMELTARAHLANRLTLETFQKADDIAKALATVGVNKIWTAAFPEPERARKALNLIVDRRNRIVHQCDADVVNPRQLTPLTDVDALEAVTTIDLTVVTIDPHC